MLDRNIVREQPERVRQSMLDRQMDPVPVDQAIELDVERRSLLSEVERLKSERNTVSKEISKMKDPTERQAKIDAMRQVGDQVAALDEHLRQVDARLDELLAGLPNFPDARVPVGKDDHDNIVMRTVGALPEFAFAPQPHWELGPALGIMDFERGVNMTGSRFYVLSGAGARLQRALIAWMLDLHILQGYT